jgi:hypothetical protein
MYAGAKMYARAMGTPDPEIHIEQWVKIPRVHETDCAGTPDAWRYFPDARVAYPDGCPSGLPVDRFNAGLIKLIRAGDYKFGHRYVEVFEMPQVTAYLSGVMDTVLELSEMDEDLYVELIVVQPRSYHREGPVRRWITRAFGLRDVLIAAHVAVERALIPLDDLSFAPQAKTGRHCLDCRARHVCTTLQRNTAVLVDFASTPERDQLDTMSLGQELVILQEAIKRLEARETGLAAQASAMIRSGQSVPFYHMEPGRSTLAYFENVTANEIVSFGDLAGVDLRRPQKLKDVVVTPTQAIDLGIDEKVMEAYAKRLPSALRLTRDNSVAIRKVFAK